VPNGHIALPEVNRQAALSISHAKGGNNLRSNVIQSFHTSHDIDKLDDAFLSRSATQSNPATG
jgi:hypothetical protein